MDNIKLSVIVPVYNMAGEHKLEYCLDSLVGQKLSVPMEILAVDDCSIDESGKILKEYEKRYPEKLIALRTDKNHRQGGAKNVGLSKARGEWIAFIDADDWVCEDYFARLLAKAEETGADCVATDYSLVTEHTMIPGKRIPGNKAEQTGELDEDKKRSMMIDFGSLCTKIYRREIIIDCPSRFPEDMFYEDNALAKTWISRMHHFAYIPEPLYYYYQHGDSTVHTVTLERLTDRVKSGRIMLEEAKKYGYLATYEPELEYSFTVLFYINTLFSCMRATKEKGAYRFVTMLAKEMKETFPKFQENPYYQSRTHEEEKRMIAMQMRSPLRFYIYYKLLMQYRKIRYGRY